MYDEGDLQMTSELLAKRVTETYVSPFQQEDVGLPYVLTSGCL